MKKLLLSLLVITILVACAGPLPTPVPTPRPTATPTPTIIPATPTPDRCALNRIYGEEITPILERNDQTLQVARSTARIALAAPIMELQKIRNEFAAVEVPDHLMNAHSKALLALDLEIQGFLSFQSEDETCSTMFHEEASILQDEAVRTWQEASANCWLAQLPSLTPQQTITEVDMNFSNCVGQIISEDWGAMVDDMTALDRSILGDDKELVIVCSDTFSVTIDRIKERILSCPEPIDRLLLDYKLYVLIGLDELSESVPHAIGAWEFWSAMDLELYKDMERFDRASDDATERDDHIIKALTLVEQATCSLEVYDFKAKRLATGKAINFSFKSLPSWA